MYWVDGIISKCSNKGRTVSDIIYLLPETEEPESTEAPDTAGQDETTAPEETPEG